MFLFELDRQKKRLFLVCCDSFAAAIAFFLALFFRLETFDYLYEPDTYIGIFFAITSSFSIFMFLGLYNNITRYISIETASSIFIGSILSCLVLLSSILLLKLVIPLTASLIFGINLCILYGGIRLLIRYLSQHIIKKNQQSVAIYGAGPDGIQLRDALRENSNYSVKIFIDDNSDLCGKNLGGIDIINLELAKKKLKSLEIKTLFLTSPLTVDSMRQKILNIVSSYPIKLIVIPNISKFIESKLKIDHLKDLKIDDLLRREPVVPLNKLMQKTISNKTVLVTGAGGTIGSELCKQIIALNPQKLLMLDISEFAIYKIFEDIKKSSSYDNLELVPLIGSVQDKEFVKEVLNSFEVDTVYHAAAYKHVPLMEQNVMQCIKNNVFGTLNIAELCLASKVKNFILVSTDKAVNPTNFMGASKRIAELICQNMTLRKKEICFSIVRFGNVLGSSGSVVPLFKKQIERGGPITLTHPEVTRYFMTISEAAQLLIQAGSIDQGGNIFVLDMGKSIKILDLAKQMIYLSGQQPVLNTIKNLEDNEIAIKITGLRPGEKLFEQLSYNSNLLETVHPRINTTFEKSMKSSELQSILTDIQDAIRDNDYKKLFDNITKVSPDVSDINTSNDQLLKVCSEKDM